MPKLDGKKYKYDKKGMKAYITELKKKRKEDEDEAHTGLGKSTTHYAPPPPGGH